ncbi:MAG TPA: Sua5/YciO/YrdC/YwlC family protein, partial [Actinomycetales bacterium]
TVALRMPLHRVALALLELTGPMAVTSANRTGQPPASTCDEAVEQLGDAVSVYLDAGTAPSALASTIVDVTTKVPRVLRQGLLSAERLRAVVPALALPELSAGAPG